MRTAKIVVIGAGSASFGLTNLGAILRTAELRGSELCLVDTNAEGLDLILRLAERINAEWKCGFVIRGATDRQSVLGGADFVILSVAIDREKCWGIDHEVARKYGIMHYAENGGPGGLMHTARNVALIMPILRDIESLCPGALVLNFTNPVPRMCIAAARFTRVRMVGICHQLAFGYFVAATVLSKHLGLGIGEDVRFRWDEESSLQFSRIVARAEERLDITAAGINHFTWMLSVRDRTTGADLYPALRDAYSNGFEEFEPLTRRLFDLFGVCPVPGDCHMVEYLPYTHNMARRTWEKYDIQMYPFSRSVRRREAMWEDIRAMAHGAKPIEHLREVHTERAELIMAGISQNSKAYEPAVNIPNLGSIQNLPEAAIVEVPAVLGADGVQGIGVGKLPEPAAELCRRQIGLAEMSVQAAVTGDRGLALQALALDPMIDDPEIAEDLFADYLAAQQEYLPQFFSPVSWL